MSRRWIELFTEYFGEEELEAVGDLLADRRVRFARLRSGRLAPSSEKFFQ